MTLFVPGKSFLCLMVIMGLVAGCTKSEPEGTASPSTPDPGQERAVFFDNLASLCGQAFAGRLVSNDATDADFAKATMVMHVRDCTPEIIRIPFHVDDNRSRTWVITRTNDHLHLAHDHRHEDGTPDTLTLYGGYTSGDAGGTSTNTKTRQDFPAGEDTKALFRREGIEVSTGNTWTLEVNPGTRFTYQMSRTNRLFRVEFDLSRPVDIPPPAWGYEGE